MRKLVLGHDGREQIEGMTNEYPYAWHYTDLVKLDVPWHWHEEVEFCYVEKGQMDITTNNTRYTFCEGEAFFMNSNVLSTMKSGEGYKQTIIDSHLLHAVFLTGHFKSIFETKYVKPVLSNRNIEVISISGQTEIQKKMIQKLKEVSSLQKQGGNIEFQTRSLFSEIWVLLLEEIQNGHSQKEGIDVRNQERIMTMMNFIHKHYAEKLLLSDIAAAAAVSERECSRCFQRNIGKSPFEYLLEYRIEEAQYLLRHSSKSVTEIAFETGFSSNAYFGKMFRQIKGMTPREYQKKQAMLKSL